MKKRHSYSLKQKLDYCKSLDTGTIDRKTASELFHVPISTGAQWFREYCCNDGELSVKKRGGQKASKLSEGDLEIIQSIVDSDVTLTTKEIRARFMESTGKVVSQETIRKSLRKYDFSFKRVYPLGNPANSQQTEIDRTEFARWFIEKSMGDDVKKILFIDETGFKLSSRIRMGWSKKGITARMRVPTVKTINKSCICAIGYSSVLHFHLLTTNGNTTTFLEFLNELFNILPEPGYTLIMDNVSFHHTECVKNLIQEKGHFLRFLPPYSPYLDGIEYFFNQWKNIVRRARPTNDDELLMAIASIHAHVTEEQCKSYFMHIVHNCEDVLAGKLVAN